MYKSTNNFPNVNAVTANLDGIQLVSSLCRSIDTERAVNIEVMQSKALKSAETYRVRKQKWKHYTKIGALISLHNIAPDF